LPSKIDPRVLAGVRDDHTAVRGAARQGSIRKLVERGQEVLPLDLVALAAKGSIPRPVQYTLHGLQYTLRDLGFAVPSSAAHHNVGADMTPDQHRHAFLAFIAGLVGDFGRYLAGGDVVFERRQIRLLTGSPSRRS
jgi:hypothetical protein